MTCSAWSRAAWSMVASLSDIGGSFQGRPFSYDATAEQLGYARLMSYQCETSDENASLQKDLASQPAENYLVR
ncbi:MAG TPA: hypothetical protein DEA75_00725 [Rhodobacteraceae bacterium]|nr:hypothetical protein [Paracoccaceae bacterium]